MGLIPHLNEEQVGSSIFQSLQPMDFLETGRLWERNYFRAGGSSIIPSTCISFIVGKQGGGDTENTISSIDYDREYGSVSPAASGVREICTGSLEQVGPSH
jgi:hypothetical protein